MKANDIAFWVVIGLGLMFIGGMSQQLHAQPTIRPDRFVVVSQQFTESGAKVIVLRDTRQPDRQCYVIYEAGMGILLDAKSPCR